MDADALPPAETYEAFAARLKSREGLQFDLPQPALIGFDDLKRSQQETLVDAFSYTFTLAQILQRLHRETYTEPFKAFLETARLFAPETRLPHPVPPFVNLHRRQHLTLAQFKAKINDPSFLKCAVNWGPPGDAQDLLSPACLLLYVWLGPTWGSPLLDFAYGMCSDATKYALAWSHCVAQLGGNTGVLDVRSQGVTASANRAKGTFSTPAQVMAHLAEKVIDILDPVAQGIFTAPAFIPVTHEELTNAIRRATPAVAAASPATQYKDLVQQHQVLSPLPTQSSLPSYEPNFSDEKNAQWFRTAQYHFSPLIFPQDALERGDASAERSWHQYACDVRHARSLCLNLSEAQVIRHLSMSFTRTAMHYQTAAEKAKTPHCTVIDWLDAIRDFFFTNGLFRHHIEQSWQTYRAGHAVDFNDFVHHIRTYYQLIFLDYHELSGDMSQQDFAWHLFEKMQYLMSQQCKSALGMTLQMYIPHSDLLKQMHLHLSPAQAWSTPKADSASRTFTVWCIEQLHVAKASANAAQRYTTTSYMPAIAVDYAAITHRPAVDHTKPPVKRNRVDNTGASSLPGAPHRPRLALAYTNGHVARPHQPRLLQNPTTSPPGSDDRKGRHLAQEVDAAMRNRNPEQQRAAARHLIRDTSFPEHLTRNCQRELDLDGAPGSLAHLYGLIAPVSDYRLPSSPAQAVLYLLRSHMHRLPMCNVCPASQQDSARRHAALECPTALGKLRGLGVDVGNLRRLAPENMTFFAHDPASGPPTAVPAKVTGGQHRHPNVKKRYDIHSHGKPPHRPRPSDMPSGPALPRKTNIR
jgi:hypothetical protein